VLTGTKLGRVIQMHIDDVENTPAELRLEKPKEEKTNINL